MPKKLLLSKKGKKVVQQKMTPAMSYNQVDVGGEEYPTDALSLDKDMYYGSGKKQKKNPTGKKKMKLSKKMGY